MHFTRAAALAATFTSASAAIRGFNTGSTNADGSGKTKDQFQSEFSNQKQITGSNGDFNSVRLYTMIQGGTTADPISAIPAAIAEGTGMLLGLWASAGDTNFGYEVQALKTAISQYGSAFTDLVQGISVGSEDLYRISPTGIANSAGNPGASPDTLVSYIKTVRNAIAGTGLSSTPVGHVDTWTAFTNSSNSALNSACDFLGLDEYPYYQSVDTNPISAAQDLFYAALEATKQAAPGKDIWITETGWPTSGATVGEAVPNAANAETYWKDIYCTLPSSTPVYWYIQFDPADPANFGVTGTSLSTTPSYDLSCDGVAAYTPGASSSTSSTAPTSTSTQVSMSGSDSSSSGIVIVGSKTTSASSGEATSSTSTGGIGGGGVVVSTTATSTAASTSATGSSNQIIGASTTMSSTTRASTTTPAASSSPTPGTGAASNIQVYTLTLLVVPAIIAFLA